MGRSTYLVRSIWRTLQGEGAWAGRPAVFVRMAVCNLWSGEEADRARDSARSGATCPTWCDTDFRRAGAARLTAGEATAQCLEVAGDIRFVVLTGGEPLLQADAALVDALRGAGFFVACETNGTVSLERAFGGAGAAPDWIVCSPKLPENRLVLETFDELKLVVPDYRPEAFARFAERIRPQRLAGAEVRYLWLQPEDGPRVDEAAGLAVELALSDPRWRVSVQTHKVLGVE